jgi:hypothetical protein
VNIKPFQAPAPHISRADVPLSQLQRDLRDLIDRQRTDTAAERLQCLLAPDTRPISDPTSQEAS